MPQQIDRYWIVQHHRKSGTCKDGTVEDVGVDFFRLFTSWPLLLTSLKRAQTDIANSHIAWLTPYRIYHINTERMQILDVTTMCELEASHYVPSEEVLEMEEPGMPMFAQPSSIMPREIKLAIGG